MMKIICLSFAILAFASFFRTGECTISAWVPILDSGATGTATLTATAQDGATAITGVSVVATTNGAISSYALTQSPSDGATFAIASDGAVSISSGALALATTSVYTFTVVATDADESQTATVTLSINDTPTFAASPYSECILDASVAGTTLNTIAASNQVGTLAYSFSNGNSAGDFTVSSAGLITTVNVMAASTTPTYTLVLEATDSSLTGTATITVSVSASCPSGCAGIVASVLTILMALIVYLQ